MNCRLASAAGIYQLAEAGLITTTAIATAPSAGVPYSTTARTSKAFRILGYVEYTTGLATAGTWSAAPDIVQLFGPGIARPGEVIQTLQAATIVTTSTTSSTYQTTNLSQAITLSGAANMVEIIACYNSYSTNSGVYVETQIHRGSTALGAMNHHSLAQEVFATQHYLDCPGAAGPTTYMIKVRNNNNSNTVYFNINGIACSMLIKEIQA